VPGGKHHSGEAIVIEFEPLTPEDFEQGPSTFEEAEEMYKKAKWCYERISGSVKVPPMRPMRSVEGHLRALLRRAEMLRKRHDSNRKIRESMRADVRELHKVARYLRLSSLEQSQEVMRMIFQVEEWYAETKPLVEGILRAAMSWERKAREFQSQPSYEQEYRLTEAIAIREGLRDAAEYRALEREWRSGDWADIDPELLD
jgi:hypothetical protein